MHRRALYSEFEYYNEALNEPGNDGRGLVVRGKHWMILGDSDYISKEQNKLSLELFNEPLLTFSPYQTFEQYSAKFITKVRCKISTICMSIWVEIVTKQV